ncbi:MAG: DNA repair protein RecO, partial [Candidatus Marinimicrobia bacterium]|nr:DNA repair protein RecO [Candidatus Neomarinimicrobiota bacterium]
MITHTPAIVLKSFPYGDTSIIARCFSEYQGKV